MPRAWRPRASSSASPPSTCSNNPRCASATCGATRANDTTFWGKVLRLEPVVGRLYRRATADLHLEDGVEPVTIPRGSLIALDNYAINADEAAVGECPLALKPGRETVAERVCPAVMSFGDGHHRCPGYYDALRESDVFLTRLLSLENLRIERKPSVAWNDLIAGYELRGFTIGLD